MIYGTHLSSIYSEHAREMQRKYYGVVSREKVDSSNDDQPRKVVAPVLSSSHTTAAMVRLAAYNFIDITV